MRFRQKMWALPLISIGVFAVGLVVAWTNARQTAGIIEQIGRVEYQYFIGLQEASTTYTALQEGLKGAVAAGDQHAIEQLNAPANALRETLGSISRLSGKEEVAATLKQGFEGWFEPAQKAAKLMITGEGDAGEAITAMQTAQVSLTDRLDTARAAAERGNELSLNAAQNSLQNGLVVNAVTALVTLGALVALSIWILRALDRGLGDEPERAIEVLSRMATGDLTRAIVCRTNDHQSLLHAAQTLQSTLVSIVGDTRRSADSVTAAARQLGAGNLDLSARTESQAGELSGTTERVHALAERTRENAASAQEAARLASEASQTAEQGGRAVADIVQTMSAIHESGRRVSEIIGLIDGIAFQTNILALNAAVEAARAGEQGRGFAVVASEVRSLAQRSAEAAKQIAALISDSVARVDNGNRQVSEAGALMDEIVQSIRRVNEHVAQISAASLDQEAGIVEVNASLADLERATQQNAALVEEASAATLSLQNQATDLGQMIARFRTPVSA